MPFVKVNLLEGRSARERDAIADAIQAALMSTLEVSDANRYQLLNEYDRGSLRPTSGYLGPAYSDHLLIVEITIREGDGDEPKQALLAEINRNLVAAGLAGADDVYVLIAEIAGADVSFGAGLTQRVPAQHATH